MLLPLRGLGLAASTRAIPITDAQISKQSAKK
jgi:hypothetical protein